MLQDKKEIKTTKDVEIFIKKKLKKLFPFKVRHKWTVKCVSRVLYGNEYYIFLHINKKSYFIQMNLSMMDAIHVTDSILVSFILYKLKSSYKLNSPIRPCCVLKIKTHIPFNM